MPPHIGPQGVQSAMNISAREASETRKVDDFITRFICKLMQPVLVNVLMNVKRIKNKVFICFKKKFFFISQKKIQLPVIFMLGRNARSNLFVLK